MNPDQTEVVTRTLDTGSFQGKQKKHFECHGTGGFVSKRDACVLEFRLWVLFFFFKFFRVVFGVFDLVWFCSLNAEHFRISMELTEGITRGDGEEREGTAQHHCYVSRVNSSDLDPKAPRFPMFVL